MNIYVDLASFAIETITDLIVLPSILNISLKKTCHPVIYAFSYFVAGSLLTHFLPDFLGWILLGIVIFYMYKCIFRTSWFNTLIIYIMNESFILAVQNLYIVATNHLNITDVNIIATSGSIFTLIVIWCICHFAPVDKLYAKFMQGSKFTKFLIIHVFMIFEIELGVRKYTDIDTMNTTPMITAFAVIIIITDIIILKQQQTINRQQHDLINYKTYQPMMSDLIDDIRGKQHDFNNQITSIKMLPLSHSDYTSLKNALLNCSDTVISEYRESDLLKINLTVVAGFLYSKIVQSRKLGKQLNVIIHEHTLKSMMPEYELIRVIGVLIDNALEAVKQGESVSLHIDSKENRITITTINEGPELSPDLRQKMFSRGYTTKTEDRSSHGLGLPNLKKLVDQYDGRICMDNSYNSGRTFIRIEVTV